VIIGYVRSKHGFRSLLVATHREGALIPAKLQVLSSALVNFFPSKDLRSGSPVPSFHQSANEPTRSSILNLKKWTILGLPRSEPGLVNNYLEFSEFLPNLPADEEAWRNSSRPFISSATGSTRQPSCPREARMNRPGPAF